MREKIKKYEKQNPTTKEEDALDKLEYTVLYFDNEERNKLGAKHDKMATLYANGHVVKTINVDHLVWEHLYKAGCFT